MKEKSELSTKTKSKVKQLEWHRSRVLKMKAKGMSQIQIAH
jgi:hypothetical protein